MTDTKHTYPEPVSLLLALGDVRGEKEWRDYLALGLTEQDVPELCRMILDEDLFWADSESDEVWSALHAWRALAQLKADSAIPALIELLGRVDAYNDDWTSEELPLVLAHIGQPALEPLSTFMADAYQGLWSRGAAGTSFAKIGEHHPELRADCVAALSRQLESFEQQDPTFNALLIGDLIDLKGVEAAPVIEQAFAAGQVDLMVQGDWEEVQIYLGLLAERTTPPPNYRKLMAAQMGFDPSSLISNIKKKLRGNREDRVETQRQAERKAVVTAKAKAKTKRKQAKRSRKKQRKRK